MIAVEFQGAPAWLCNHPHNWAAPAALRLAALVDDDRSQTGREGRRPVDDTLRARAESTARLHLAQIAALRNALQTAQAEPVLMPVWALALSGEEWAATPHVEGSLVIGWMEDWSSFTISEGPLAFPNLWHYVAPLLQGYFAKEPDTRAINDEGIDVRFAFEEDDAAGSFPLVPDVAPIVPTRPALGAFTPAAFPWEVDWAKTIKSGHAAIRIARHDVGGSRRKLIIAHPQSPERPVEGTVTLQGAAEIARFITWWRRRHGSADAHWVSTWISGGRLAADAAAGAEELELETGANIGGNRFLALHTAAGVEFVAVESVDGNTLHLAAPLVAAAPRFGTRLSLAILGRHAREEVTINFTSPYTATATLSWRELAAEYTVPAGEQRGFTLGRKPAKAYLFAWTEDYSGAAIIHRTTNWRTPITIDEETWTPRLLEMSERTSSGDPTEHGVEIKAEWWDGCPFRHFMPGQLAARVSVTIYEVPMNDGEPGDVTQIWQGEVKSAPRKGLSVTVKVGGPSEIYARRFPVNTFGPNCNAELFDGRCGLAREAWRITADVVGLDVALTVNSFARAGGLPAGFGFAHWFAGGVLEWTVGDITRRVSIYDSSAVVGGAAELVVRSSEGIPEGEVSLWPGCDKRRESCLAWHATNNPEGKFNNYAKFRGFPFIPARAPQFTLPKKSASATGKK